MAVIDHLVVAVADLEGAIEWFAGATGVRPAIGGSHDGMGTHNALVSLGDSYLEFIAPDPTQPDPPSSGHPRPFGLDDELARSDGQPVLVGFAVRPDDDETLDEVGDRMADAGHDPGYAIDMSRRTPDGELLAWRLTVPTQRTLPFLIDWGSTPKPHTTQPAGVQLREFEIVHPRPFDLLGVIAALGLDITVVGTEHAGDAEGLRATLASDVGDVTI